MTLSLQDCFLHECTEMLYPDDRGGRDAAPCADVVVSYCLFNFARTTSDSTDAQQRGADDISGDLSPSFIELQGQRR